ncbi:hypothetical protein [Leucobacter chromiireducens]|uniref:DUF1772 domain-containing protein n=1 Tax=Leucobacter chromiireducens subsp. chromiireducens TaxID=660067 RepID=A0ABS1SNL9_9MICO|nr:hypothetical protein [Leucobacter chromiireducens]MBL3689500.1 hypothetical protein [Leucobacter chromiireducens subsp. chromiireducens]
MVYLVIPFSLVSVALVYVPVAMLVKGKLQEYLSKGPMRNPWARFALLLLVLGGLAWFVQWAVTEQMKDAWEAAVLWCTAVLVILSVAANAPIPSDPDESTPDEPAEDNQRPFWDWTERVNAKSFVTALAAVLGAMSLGLWFV